MDPYANEWLDLLVRWLHVIVAIAWIGSSFYFIALDNHLRPPKEEADSERGGMLALHETWYPGWVAEIDGRKAPVLRADVLFRGVEVPAGRHDVVFRFAPFSLDNLASALSLALGRPH